MSTDYHFVCYTCKSESPLFASASIAYGYKVWPLDDALKRWFGHREAVGHHESHDLRIVSEHFDPPWGDIDDSEAETEKLRYCNYCQRETKSEDCPECGLSKPFARSEQEKP